MSTKIKILYAVLAILAIYALWPSSEVRDSATIRVWDAKVNEQGNLNVLGVVLGESTLKQAEAALYTQSERALFVTLKEGEPAKESIEAFFPTSPDRAKIIIQIDAAPDLIERIRKNAPGPIVYPSGSAKFEILPQFNREIEASAARSLTYIPSLRLTPEQVEQHFGKSERQITDVDDNLHLLYPALGLDVVIAREGNPLLQFVPPAEFDKLLALVKQRPEDSAAP